MELKNGEIRHDGSIEDQRFYLRALELGMSPGFPPIGDSRNLDPAFTDGFFTGELEGSEAVLRGLVKLSLSHSRLNASAVAHLAKFAEEARRQSAEQ